MRKILHAFILAKRHLRGQLKVKEINFIKRFIHSDDVCLDIGAHGGSWSKPLSSLVNKGKVYSFEALPYYADVLKMLFKILFIKNIRVINMAVGEKEGTLSLAWKDEEGKRLTGKTHIVGKNEVSNHTITIPSITLDKFISDYSIEKIRFIKIDVEGAEIFVFKGGVNMIEKFRPIIYCELDERWTSRYDYKPEDVFDFFTSRNYYSYIIKKGEVAEEIDKNSYSKKGDVLFLPREHETKVI